MTAALTINTPIEAVPVALPELAAAAVWEHHSRLNRWVKNPRKNLASVPRVAESIKRFGFVAPIVVWASANRMVAGDTRVQAMALLMSQDPAFIAKGAPGPGMVRVVFHDFDSEAEADLYALADNRLQELASWDDDGVAAILASYSAEDRVVAGYDPPATLPDEGPSNAGALQAKFGVPPFSVLDARQGYWQERKDAWLALGIKSEVGRGPTLPGLIAATEMQAGTYQPRMIEETASLKGGLTFATTTNPYRKAKGKPDGGNGLPTTTTTIKDLATVDAQRAGTSIFDPVLTELLVRWFCPPTGRVLDPFAGGSVRGIVSAATGRAYTGIELREEQVTANRDQWIELRGKLKPESPTPTWIHGDSTCGDMLLDHQSPGLFDFIMTCPPYADLEVYSDDPRDISTMAYNDFLAAYRKIVSVAVGRLALHRFAAVVVGDVRAPDGCYRNFVSHTISAFEDAGTKLHNEAILVTSVGSLPIRAGRQFQAGRKLGKTHQNVLVFVKGDPKKATQAIGDVDFGEDASPGDT